MASLFDGIFSRQKERVSKDQETKNSKNVSPQTLPIPQVRIVFMGTPSLAATLLEALVREKYQVVAVVTQTDKPVGRKQEQKPSAVKEVALRYSLSLEQPGKLDTEAIKKIRDWKPDLLVVAAYGKILPEELLKIPGLGCVNVHPSLLPRWRGASPIQNALLAGDTETGVTLMLMDKGMDTGDIISQEKISIETTDTQEVLREKVAQTGEKLLLETLPLWVKQKITPTPQGKEGATLCQLIEREDGHILFTNSAESIYNRYRALYPWPGIFAFWKKNYSLQRIKLEKISYQEHSPEIAHTQGEVFEIGGQVAIQTGQGVIFIEEIKPEGKSQMLSTDFVRGNQDFIGTHLK